MTWSELTVTTWGELEPRQWGVGARTVENTNLFIRPHPFAVEVQMPVGIIPDDMLWGTLIFLLQKLFTRKEGDYGKEDRGWTIKKT